MKSKPMLLRRADMQKGYLKSGQQLETKQEYEHVKVRIDSKTVVHKRVKKNENN